MNFATENGITNTVDGDDCRPITEKINTAAPIDTDRDGLSNDQETQYGTDPNNSDTDGDGYFDGAEVQGGYNPNGLGKL